MQFEKTLKTSNIVQEVNVNITTKYIHLVILNTTYLVLSIHLLLFSTFFKKIFGGHESFLWGH